MSKVSVHLGITYPGSVNFSSFRSDVTISDIEVEKDIPSQVEEALLAIIEIGTAAEEALAQQAANASGMAVEGVGLATEFYQFREKDKAWKKKVADHLKIAIEKKASKKEKNNDSDE